MSQSRRASVKTLLRTVSSQVVAVSVPHPGSHCCPPPQSRNLDVLPPADLRSLAPPPAPNILQLCVTLSLALIVWQRWPTPLSASSSLTFLLHSSAKPNPPLYQRKGMNYFLSRQRWKGQTSTTPDWTSLAACLPVSRASWGAMDPPQQKSPTIASAAVAEQHCPLARRGAVCSAAWVCLILSKNSQFVHRLSPD